MGYYAKAYYAKGLQNEVTIEVVNNDYNDGDHRHEDDENRWLQWICTI